MKNKNSKFLSLASGIVIVLATALPVFAAEVTEGVNVSVSGKSVEGEVHATATTDTKMEGETEVRNEANMSLRDRAKSRGEDEIDRRVKSLTELSDRIKNAAKLSDDEKASLNSELQAQISAMTELRTKINDDADHESTSTLRADLKSILDTHRIFALIMPQAAIHAAADRALAIVAAMNDVGTKLQARITEAQTAGNNVSISATAMADFTAKVSDAGSMAQAAIDAVKGLTPDNGDQAKFQANLAALKSARTKIQAAQRDLVAARSDAKVIVKELRNFSVGASASTTVSSTASTTTGQDQ